MNLTRYEQETTINYNEGEDTASIYTHTTRRCAGNWNSWLRSGPRRAACSGPVTTDRRLSIMSRKRG